MITTDHHRYAFGTVDVSVDAELVTIAEPYDSLHEDFVEASLFVERYTHASEATVIEDDTAQLTLWIYPNTESLVGLVPTLPDPDPRLKPTVPRQLPIAEAAEAVQRDRRRRVVDLTDVEPYMFEIATRGGAALLNLIS